MKSNRCIIVSNPIPANNASPKVTIEKFSRVLSGVFDEGVIVCGNAHDFDLQSNVSLRSIACKRTGSKARRVASFLLCEIKAAAALLSCSSRGDDVFFWIADKMIVPFVVAKLRGMTTYYMIAGNVANEGKGARFSRALIDFMANRSSFVFAESQSVFQEWDLCITDERKKCLHLYVEGRFSNRVVSELRKVGMLCRLTPGKHVIESIKAVARFNQLHDSPVTLQIVGDGPQKEECRSLIRSLGAEDYVELLGWVDHSLVEEITSQWDLLLFPTDAEGLPNAPLEAMVNGVPALASPVGGINDVISDGQNGWLLSGADVGSIVDSLLRISQLEPDEVRLVSANAQKTVRESYSLSGAILNAQRELESC